MKSQRLNRSLWSEKIMFKISENTNLTMPCNLNLGNTFELEITLDENFELGITLDENLKNEAIITSSYLCVHKGTQWLHSYCLC